MRPAHRRGVSLVVTKKHGTHGRVTRSTTTHLSKKTSPKHSIHSYVVVDSSSTRHAPSLPKRMNRSPHRSSRPMRMHRSNLSMVLFLMVAPAWYLLWMRNTIHRSLRRCAYFRHPCMRDSSLHVYDACNVKSFCRVRKYESMVNLIHHTFF